MADNTDALSVRNTVSDSWDLVPVADVQVIGKDGDIGPSLRIKFASPIAIPGPDALVQILKTSYTATVKQAAAAGAVCILDVAVP